jgi:hypothetical protein
MKLISKKSGLLLAATLLLSAPSLAQAQLFELGIEPIIGYEMVQKVLPTRHRVSRLTYGGRITAGILLLSAELEYTRSNDEESFTSPTRTIADTDDKLKLGLRSGFGLGHLITLTARGGVQAQQNKHEDTLAGVKTTSYTPVTYNPYAGAELRLRLTHKITASAGVVVVVHDFNDMVQNEYQTTAGFSIYLP